MVQQKRVIVTDDLDGTEGAKPYRFAWQNTVYEIDLNDEHRDELLRALQPFIDAGRRAGRRTVHAASGDDRAAIRQWARENGHEVSDRGRISAAVVEAYNNR
ncbi:Lsr2 family protein [Cellulosimicrobium sp. TH-20]|uniref:histone-like nucleoid-structuring protein Lsr2 n=1 Tax=Cellulosimicrobium sp. TH-20 TaxID=1980001 RepID=UPI00119DD6AD|nr:Lsr2 family protein [Cellulosimicrobium sp. TH-20]